MTLLENLQRQAGYNRWINARLFDVCARVSDADRRRNKGAFFGSIHGTLNRLLLVDELWLAHIENRDFPVTSLAEERHHGFNALRAARTGFDHRFVTWLDALSPEALRAPVRYVSLVDRHEHAWQTDLVLTHLFHHQSYHRGQLTTLLSQLGMDFGETDLLFMPDIEPFSA